MDERQIQAPSSVEHYSLVEVDLITVSKADLTRVLSDNEKLRQRVTELLDSNNKEIAKRRKAEDKLMERYRGSPDPFLGG